MRPVAARGRRIWGLAGLAVAASIAIPGGWFITTAGTGWNGASPADTVTRVLTVAQPVTTVNVLSYGGPVRVTAGPVRSVQVTETIVYDPREGALPAAPPSVSNGILTVTASVCQDVNCTVGLVVSVPLGVGVAAQTQGGLLAVSGTASANLDSGGGPVEAGGINGHLIVATEGGSAVIRHLAGPLVADTGGGSLLALGVSATTATVITSGGDARIEFRTAPDGVFVSTGGGAATLTVPGGPYALTANAYGGPDTVAIATGPAAGRSITVTTAGGPLEIVHPAGSGG